MQKVFLADMDGVFCDFSEGLYRLAAEITPEVMPYLPDRATQQHFYIDDCISDPSMARVVTDLCNNPRLFSMLPPFEGAIDGMHQLREELAAHDIALMICTAPHKENKESYSSKAIWIERFLGVDWLDSTLIVRDKTVCSGIVLLDDKPDPLGKFIPDWEHVVMDHAYNRGVTGKRRFTSWSADSIKELVEYTAERYNRYKHNF